MPPAPINKAFSFLQIIDDVQVDNDLFYFSALKENGQVSLFALLEDGNSKEILPEEYSIRSKLYGYGGRSFEAKEGKLFFIHAKDQGIYALDAKGAHLICKDFIFGDLHYSPINQCLFALCGKKEKNCIVKIDLTQNTCEELVIGHTFYANLALSQDENSLAFVAWNHPHMPWDESYVYTLHLPSKTLTPILEKKEVSATDPYFIGNELFYLSDESGFWNLYNTKRKKITDLKADLAEPLWQFGRQRLKRLNEWQTLLIYTSCGEDFLALLDQETYAITPLSLPYNTIKIALSYKGEIVLYAGSSTSPLALHFLREAKSIEGKEHSPVIPLISSNRHGNPIYSYFYPPVSSSHLKSLPPLIVKCHSGPTSRVTSLLNSTIQFFTERGFAFLETNYSGSSGYGREYRNRLIHQFGEIDVTDCIDAVEFLIARKKVDPSRIVIMGSSSGGMTALLATLYSPLFKAAILSYPVLDLSLLAKETHDFERHYFDRLVATADFTKRSPLHQADKIKAPLLLFQGKKDNVTPPFLMEQFYEKVKKHATLILFEDEGHSFKKFETKKCVLEKTLLFIEENIKQS